MPHTFRRSARPTTEAHLAVLERQFGLTFPDDYRSFLLAHNGGYTRSKTFHYRDKKGRSREAWVGFHYSVGADGVVDLDDKDLASAWAARPAGLPAGLVPFAHAWSGDTEGFLCLNAGTGPDRGAVYYRPEVDPHRDTAHPVAASFSAYLDSLKADEKPKSWQKFIDTGDSAGLRELLASKPKWRKNHEREHDILESAVEEGHWPILEVLLDEGVSATDLFDRALRHARFGLVRHLLARGGIDPDEFPASLTAMNHLHLWNDLDLVRTLIERGADVNFANESGATALHKAAELGRLAAVQFLLDHGADPTVRNDPWIDEKQGKLPHEVATVPEVAQLLKTAAANWKPPPIVRTVQEPNLHGVTFSRSGPTLTLEQLIALEEEYQLDLPPEYRGFLLKHNGGVPRPNTFPVSRSEDDDDDEAGSSLSPAEERRLTEQFRKLQEKMVLEGRLDDEELQDQMREIEERLDAGMDSNATAEIQWFFPWGRDVGKKTPSFHEELETCREGWGEDDAPKRMIPIGSGDGPDEGFFVLLSCRGHDRGKVYLFEHGAVRLADSLSDLFQKLAGAAKKKKASPQDAAVQAAQDGDVPALEAALAAGAKPNKLDNRGRSPLNAAASEGHLAAVQLLLRHSGKKGDAFKGDAFHEALQAGQFTLARALLESGLKPQILTDALTNHFLYQDLDLARAVIDAGGDVSHRSSYGLTPLHAAADLPEPDAVRLLLARGAKTNVWSDQGELPLHAAARLGRLDTCKALIDAGEDLYARPPADKHPSGMSEKQLQQMSRMMASGLKSLQGMMGDMLDDQGDLPPEVVKAAQETDAEIARDRPEDAAMFKEFLGAPKNTLAAMAMQHLTTPPNAADAAERSLQGQAILKELKAYAAKKKG